MMKFLSVSALTLTSSQLLAMAQDEDAISTSAIYACAEIADDTERLACYDETVGRFEAAEAAGEVTTISKTEIEEIQKDSFGFSLPSIPRLVMPRFGGDEEKSTIDEVTLAVTKVERLRYDNLRVTLENGQIWEQTDGKRVQYSKRLGVESASIKKASFGSFKMKLDDGASFRVKRIR